MSCLQSLSQLATGWQPYMAEGCACGPPVPVSCGAAVWVLPEPVTLWGLSQLHPSQLDGQPEVKCSLLQYPLHLLPT